MKKKSIFNFIAWASFGPDVSENVLDFAIYIAKAFDSQIHSLYVKPTTYNPEKSDCFSETDIILNNEWNEFTYRENLIKIKYLQNKIRSEDIRTSSNIIKGVPCYKILNFADKNRINLIMIDKGMNVGGKCVVQKTTTYVVNNSKVPVLSVIGSSSFSPIKKILVPVDIHNVYSVAFKIAIHFAGVFKNCKITLLNVQNRLNPSLPAEEAEKKHSDAYFKLSGSGLKKMSIHTAVLDYENISDGVVEYAKSNKFDLVIFQVFSGKKQNAFHAKGSIKEKIFQNTECPILTINTGP